MRATWKLAGFLAVAFSAMALVSTIATADGVANPTFTKDIAPIFQQKCEACHRPDSMAPMSLMTYEEARPWARSIKTRVEARQMPPWSIDKTAGIQEFKNDRSLSDDQIATIERWIDAGAPKGDPKDMPPAVKWPDDQGWNFAKALFAPSSASLPKPSSVYITATSLMPWVASWETTLVTSVCTGARRLNR